MSLFVLRIDIKATTVVMKKLKAAKMIPKKADGSLYDSAQTIEMAEKTDMLANRHYTLEFKL